MTQSIDVTEYQSSKVDDISANYSSLNRPYERLQPVKRHSRISSHLQFNQSQRVPLKHPQPKATPSISQSLQVQKIPTVKKELRGAHQRVVSTSSVTGGQRPAGRRNYNRTIAAVHVRSQDRQRARKLTEAKKLTTLQSTLTDNYMTRHSQEEACRTIEQNIAQINHRISRIKH